MTAPDLPDYAYNGARAMVILHDREMRRFLAAWRKAKDSGLSLPETRDRDYASLDHLLRHVLGCAAGYMVWMCEKLELGAPDCPLPPPSVETMEAEADAYLDRVLAGWHEPLAGVPEKRFNEEYTSRWNVEYCIDAMMEHAVMHPIRHRYQLEQLLG